MNIPGDVPAHYIIEAYARLGFTVEEGGFAQLSFRNEEGVLLFHAMRREGMINVPIALEDIEIVEAINSLPSGWGRETWLAALLDVMQDPYFTPG